MDSIDQGYWIECVPIHQETNENFSPDLYAASIDSFPEMNVTAKSPDRAVEKLRKKLKQVKDFYEKSGRLLPDPHNPVIPTSRYRSQAGWMSVYVDLKDKG